MEGQGSILFEEDYIFRNGRMITSLEDIVLTELVVNAWDAGAQRVDIYIPNKDSDKKLLSMRWIKEFL